MNWITTVITKKSVRYIMDRLQKNTREWIINSLELTRIGHKFISSYGLLEYWRQLKVIILLLLLWLLLFLLLRAKEKVSRLKICGNFGSVRKQVNIVNIHSTEKYSNINSTTDDQHILTKKTKFWHLVYAANPPYLLTWSSVQTNAPILVDYWPHLWDVRGNNWRVAVTTLWMTDRASRLQFKWKWRGETGVDSEFAVRGHCLDIYPKIVGRRKRNR